MSKHAASLSLLIVVALFTLGGGPGRVEAHDIGMNTHGWPIGTDVTRDLGMSKVRAGCCDWLTVQPTAGVFDWQRGDPNGDCGVAANGGLELVGGFGYTPQWASTGDRNGDGATCVRDKENARCNDVPRRVDWENWVNTVMYRCKDHIKYWQIWNEPNDTVFFEGSRAEFVDEVLLPAAQIIRNVCPDCKIVAPGLADVGNHDGTPRDWLNWTLYRARNLIDIVDAHVYEPPGGVAAYVDGLHDLMNAWGVGAKPFWITETNRWGGARLCQPAEMEAQRQYLLDLFKLAAARPWWTRTYLYMAFDSGLEGYGHPPGCGYAANRFGLVVPGMLDAEWKYQINQWGDPYYAKSAFHFLQQLTAQDNQFGGDGIGGSVTSATGPTYDAAIVSETIPGTLGVYQSYQATVTVQNTGAYTWYGELDYHLLQNSVTVYTIPDGTRVPPGGTYTFAVTVYGGAGPGTRTETFQMVKDAPYLMGPTGRIPFGETASQTVTTVSSTPVPIQIRYRELDTRCSSTQPVYYGWLNWNTLPVTYYNRLSQDCTCTPGVRTAAVTTSINGYRTDGRSTLELRRTSSPFTSWVKAVTLWSDGSSTSDCLYDVNGGNCDVTNLCSAGYGSAEQWVDRWATPVGRGLAPANSCAGQCGGSGGSCWCDAACTGYGDCCADKADVCDW